MTCKVDFSKKLEQDLAVDGFHLVAEANEIRSANAVMHVPEKETVMMLKFILVKIHSKAVFSGERYMHDSHEFG